MLLVLWLSKMFLLPHVTVDSTGFLLRIDDLTKYLHQNYVSLPLQWKTHAYSPVFLNVWWGQSSCTDKDESGWDKCRKTEVCASVSEGKRPGMYELFIYHVHVCVLLSFTINRQVYCCQTMLFVIFDQTHKQLHVQICRIWTTLNRSRDRASQSETDIWYIKLTSTGVCLCGV